MPLKAVAFDIDGTLYPNRIMYWKSVPFFLKRFSLVRAFSEVRHELRAQSFPPGDFHRIQAEFLGRNLGISSELAYKKIEQEFYTRWFRIFRHLRPYPVLKETLDYLQGKGIPLGVMSDFPIRNRLKDLGLGSYWKTAFSSEETGFLKPRPEAFLRIASDLGCEPSEILYVGNSYHYDVLGAKDAGFLAAHLTRKKRENSRADFQFRHYNQLLDYLRELLGENAPAN